MFIDLKGEILDVLASPEGQRLLHEAIAVVKAARAARAPELDDDRLITAKEAAVLLGMSERAVRQAAHRGTLPTVHVGRRLRFRRSDLIRSAA